MVGYGGVVGGGDGEEESEEMTATGGFVRRRFGVDPTTSSPSVSTSSERVSSISSWARFCIALAKWGRLESGETCCVAAAAFPILGFCVELEVNLGAGVN